jgi:hypothetical protein
MRLAPGHAIPFYPKETGKGSNKRPWILVSGDQAGKVWMMKPVGIQFDYETAIVLDINDYYGPGTTQTFTPSGFTISTIGEPAIFYSEVDAKSRKEKASKSMSKQTKHGLQKGGATTRHQHSKSKSRKTNRMSKSGKELRWSKSSKCRHSKGKRHGFLRHKPAKESRVAQIYIPIFEAKEIHILSFDGDKTERIKCPVDNTYECTEQ